MIRLYTKQWTVSIVVVNKIQPKEVIDNLFTGLGLWCLTPISTIFQLYTVKETTTRQLAKSEKRKNLASMLV
jgi:hypothetical protein